MTMGQIPEQLKEMRFNRVMFKEKRAFEKGWQNNPYSYYEIQNYFPNENYGVLCGSELRVLDDDTPNKGLIKVRITTTEKMIALPTILKGSSEIAAPMSKAANSKPIPGQ